MTGDQVAGRGRGSSSSGSTLRSGGQILALIVLIVCVCYLAIPPFRHWTNNRISSIVGTVHPTYTSLPMSGATASTQVTDHPASAAIDGLVQTYWSAQYKNNQPALVVKFSHPVTVDRMDIHSASDQNFLANYRPRAVEFVYSNGRRFSVELQDIPAPQEVPLEGGQGTTSVEIRVLSVYNSSHRVDNVAIAEVTPYVRD